MINPTCRFLPVLLACLTATACQADTDTPLPPPNVVVFLADDMGLGDTSAYRDWTGNADAVQVYTPSMERLARMGVRLTDGHSPASRCTPSRYALMTGRYCWRTRLKQFVLFGVHTPPLIERDQLTLPEFLQEHGYRTALLGKWHLGLTYRDADGGIAQGWADADLTQPIADGPVDHGFDFFLGFSRSHPTSGPNGQARNTPNQSIGPGWIDGRDITGATGNGKRLDGSYVLTEIGPRLDEAMKRLVARAGGSDAPLFLYYASHANHTTYDPADAIAGVPIKGASRFVDGRPTGSVRLDFVYQNDVMLGQLIDTLAETPDPRRPGHAMLDNTLLIFASDNGAEVNRKTATGPLRSNKASVFEGGHRVPVFVSWPAGGIGDGDTRTPGQDVDRLFGLNDVYATMAEVLGAELPPLRGAGRGAEDSHGQLAAWRGEAMPARAPLYSHDHKEAGGRERANQRAVVSVRSNDAPIPGQWKLLLDHTYAHGGMLNPIALYELGQDLQETTNRLDDPACEAVVAYLIDQARQHRGDDGRSR